MTDEKKEKLLKVLGERFIDDPKAARGIHDVLAKFYEEKLNQTKKEHAAEMKTLKDDLTTSFKEFVREIRTSHTTVLATLDEVTDNVRKNSEEYGKTSKTLEQKVSDVVNLHKNLDKKFGTRLDKFGTRVEKISEFAVGAPNRSLYVSGSLPSAYYSDVNFLPGMGVTITPGTDEQNQQATITISASGGGFTVIEPTSGAVNSSNTVFTFAEIPSFILSDGVLLPATGNNGDVFWTISGTTVTMVNPPAYSLLGVV